MTSDEELETKERFRLWYELENETLAEIERQVIGADYGANGYTSRTQVDDIIRRIQLGASDRVLDVGTGRGWPAIYHERQEERRITLAAIAGGLLRRTLYTARLPA